MPHHRSVSAARLAKPPGGWTVDEFYRLDETGALPPDRRFELLDGAIIDMPPIGDAHVFAVDSLVDLLVRNARGRYWVSNQSPLPLSERTAPQPDVVVLAGSRETYRQRRRRPSDVLLLIEVAAASLHTDSTAKRAEYVAAGIPHYWIVDVESRRLIAHAEPGPSGYGLVCQHASGSLAVPGFPDVALTLDDLFAG